MSHKYLNPEVIENDEEELLMFMVEQTNIVYENNKFLSKEHDFVE